MDAAPWPGERSRHGGVDRIPLPRNGLGRVWLCGKHFVGPDPERALASVDATTVVCLNEVAELEDRYPQYVDWLRRNGGPNGRAVWHPIPDLHAPEVDDALTLLDELRARLDAGEGLLVSCGAGRGRAGTIAAALLVLAGATPDDAIRTVATHRPMAGPEAGPQAELLDALAGRTMRRGL